MLTVRIVTDNPHYDNLLRQLPEEAYSGFRFTVDEEVDCDALVVIDYAKRDITVNCNPQNVWLWNMEPPDEEWEWLRKGYKHYSKIVTIDQRLQHPKIIKHQLAIPWQINRTYDQLANNSFFGDKHKELSFITSSYAARKGHRNRLKFLDQITGKIDFDLWGRGFKNMDDKTDGLRPYKYSIVVENSRYQDYFSEKIADAFLCGCIPFYYGCTNIGEYFPKNSFISIDINKPREAIAVIKEAIENNEWEKRKTVIEQVRRTLLNEYQFFAVFKKLFQQHGFATGARENIAIPKLSHHPSEVNPLSLNRNIYLVKKTLFKKRYLDLESPYFGFTAYK